MPVEEKETLVDARREAANYLRVFCTSREVDLDALAKLRGFQMVSAGREAVEKLMLDEDETTAFLSRASLVKPAVQGDPA